MIAGAMCHNVLLFLFSRWTPGFIFDRQSFHFLFRYGINGLGASIAEYFNSNIDYLLVGNLLGPKALGLYEFAYRIPHLIASRMAGPLRLIMFPALSMVSNSNEKIISGYLKGVRFISLFTFPALGGLAVVANIAVPLLWGDQWVTIVIPLQILCFSAILQGVGGSARIIFILKDRPDIPFKFNLIKVCFAFAMVATLGYFWGILGVALGMAISALSDVYLLLWGQRFMRSPIKSLILSIYPMALSTLATMIAAFFIKTLLAFLGMPLAVIFILCVTGAILVYFAVIFFFFNEVFEEGWQLFRAISGFDLPLKMRDRIPFLKNARDFAKPQERS
jgi:O-antigen/teichoic acid export membrane protein